jgi:hypothetical protein
VAGRVRPLPRWRATVLLLPVVRVFAVGVHRGVFSAQVGVDWASGFGLHDVLLSS